MNDFMAVQISQPFQNMFRDMSQIWFREGAVPAEEVVESAGFHVLQNNLDVAGRFFRDPVALDDVRGIGAAEDFHFPENLPAYGRIVVAVDDFEGVDLGGSFMLYFVDCAAVSVAEDLKSFEIGR